MGTLPGGAGSKWVQGGGVFGVCLNVSVWWSREKSTTRPAHPQYSKQDLHGAFTM